MKKENFINAIETLRKHYEQNEKLNSVVFELASEYFPDFSRKLVSMIIDLLESEMSDGYQTIYWYLFDTPNGIEGDVKDGVLRDKDGNSIDISTPDKLYDYLVEIEK